MRQQMKVVHFFKMELLFDGDLRNCILSLIVVSCLQAVPFQQNVVATQFIDLVDTFDSVGHKR